MGIPLSHPSTKAPRIEYENTQNLAGHECGCPGRVLQDYFDVLFIPCPAKSPPKQTHVIWAVPTFGTNNPNIRAKFVRQTIHKRQASTINHRFRASYVSSKDITHPTTLHHLQPRHQAAPPLQSLPGLWSEWMQKWHEMTIVRQVSFTLGCQLTSRR